MTGAWELNWQRQINKRKGTQILCNVNTNLNFYMHGGLHRKAIRTPNKQLDLGACIHFNKGRSIWKNDKTKRKRGLGFCCFVVVQLLSHIWLFATPWTVACQASLSFTVSQSLLKFMSTESVMPSNHHILCRPLLLLPSIFPSIRVFSNALAALSIRWPEYWSFNFSSSPCSEYPGLISCSFNPGALNEVMRIKHSQASGTQSRR